MGIRNLVSISHNCTSDGYFLFPKLPAFAQLRDLARRTIINSRGVRIAAEVNGIVHFSVSLENLPGDVLSCGHVTFSDHMASRIHRSLRHFDKELNDGGGPVLSITD